MKRIDPVHQITSYFENASVESAQTLLSVVAAIVERRAPKTKKPRATKPPAATPLLGDHADGSEK